MIKKILALYCVILLSPDFAFAQKRQTIVRTQQKTEVKKGGTSGSSPKVRYTPKKKTVGMTPKKNNSKSAIFSISSTYANFTSLGGTKTFTISSTNPWNVSVGTASWGELRRNGNQLILRVDENTSYSSRSDYFDIASGKKTIRVNINQEYERLLSVSTSDLRYSSTGGSQTITVTSNDYWEIGTKTYSWGHLYVSGNNITLTIDPNIKNENRTDYFTIKSGGIEKRINISQDGVSKLEISSTVAKFSENGGSKTFTVKSTDKWEIETSTASWGHLTINGNTLVLTVDANYQNNNRNDYFTIKSGNDKIRVNIEQAAGSSYLSVNGSTERIYLDYETYGFSKNISVNTNANDYEIWGKPYWCQVRNKTSKGFNLACSTNNSSFYRSDYMEVRTEGKRVRINIRQEPNSTKYRRRINGGWVNMAIGYEGGYGINGDKSWCANGVLGLRIGNYKDVMQIELGATPGVISVSQENSIFHLPLYGSLKLSTTNGAFYLKMGGTYNIIRDDKYEGQYSLRAGFGSAWKHFEWDWAYAQLNAPSEYYGKTKLKDLFDTSKMMVGMRMSWYITR